jgi:hypothetical protein
LIKETCIGHLLDRGRLSSTFAAACRAADEKQRRKRVAPAIERLRRLLDDGISLVRAWHELSKPSGRAADGTVDALVFALRRGLDAIKHPDNQRRLSELDDTQMRAVAARLQNFMPHIAPAWKSADVEALISAWSKLRC